MFYDVYLLCDIALNSTLEAKPSSLHQIGKGDVYDSRPQQTKSF